jgi:hypothetical protein
VDTPLIPQLEICLPPRFFCIHATGKILLKLLPQMKFNLLLQVCIISNTREESTPTHSSGPSTGRLIAHY